MAVALQDLPYARDALMPHLSGDAVAYHHDHHEKAYVETVKRLVQGGRLANATLSEIAARAAGPLANAAAQAWNHAFYWTCMSPQETRPQPEARRAIDHSFGSVDAFKRRLREAGLQLFGSGWIWLVRTGQGELQILPTPNAGLRVHEDGLWPILICDVWEHAYYIDYRGERGRYLDGFLDLLNWNRIAERLAEHTYGGTTPAQPGLGPPAETADGSLA